MRREDGKKRRTKRKSWERERKPGTGGKRKERTREEELEEEGRQRTEGRRTEGTEGWKTVEEERRIKTEWKEEEESQRKVKLKK